MKSLKSNAIFAAIFTSLLLLPDFIATTFWKNYYIITSKNTIKELFITFIISLIISTLRKKEKLFWGVFFLSLAFIQIGYFGFFRSYLQPYQIDLVFSEFKDILDSLYSIVTLVIFLIVALIIELILINLFHYKLKPKSFKYSSLILILLLIVFPFFVSKKRSIYIPNPTHFSYLNTLFAINLWVINKLSPNTQREYKPYIVKKVSSGKNLVVVVMGESLNYKRMHLYGWNINNTPNLDKLKKDKNFYYFKAVSAGINTPVSMVSFFNLKREPDNIKLLISQKTNLLKLAKENNYTTYWLSMQEEGTSISTILNYADFKKTRKDYKVKFDDSLIEDLKKIDLNKKSFIVIHLRANHSPYEKYTPKRFYKWSFNYEDYHRYKVFSYYNSILYVDYILFSIIDYLKDKNASIYFTSDHGEMLGFKDEKGRYGHSQLLFEDALVPFIYYGENNLTNKTYNHYQIGKLIAKDLGYIVKNPNENGLYYLNGVSIDGSSGYLKYSTPIP